MPDEDERERDGTDGASLEDMLEVQTLMGWDGDRCLCPDCRCERFRDGSDAVQCEDCLRGRHAGDEGRIS